MYSPKIKQKIEAELSDAQAARDQGLEGRARVCARRAAGAAVRAFLRRQNAETEGSAFELLQALQSLPGVSDTARHAAEMLTQRVNHDHHLPHEADLLEEARKLIDLLEPEDSSSASHPTQ